jgi:hypothetical protein
VNQVLTLQSPVVTLCTTSFKIQMLHDRDGHAVDGDLPFDTGSSFFISIVVYWRTQ